LRRYSVCTRNLPDKGFATGRKGRAAIWAGAGVGLVNEVESAANITNSVRAETKAVLKKIYKQYGNC
jgi:nitronate monooxygenase